MTWDEWLILIAEKHSISLKSCFSTEEKETRIKQKLPAAKYQQYWLRWRYRQAII